MKKIDVIKEQCIGCGACVAIDAEHFDFDDEGRSNVISNENLDSANLTNAIESCPTSAIQIVEGEETDTCECNCGCEDCTCGTDVECTCGCEDCTCGCENECDCDEDCDCECDCNCCGCHEEEN